VGHEPHTRCHRLERPAGRPAGGATGGALAVPGGASSSAIRASDAARRSRRAPSNVIPLRRAARAAATARRVAMPHYGYAGQEIEDPESDAMQRDRKGNR
jgi:hypothetical protein